MSPLRFCLIIAVALELVLLSGLRTYAAEPVHQVIVVSTNPVRNAMLDRCEQLTPIAYRCLLTSNDADELGGYADTTLLTNTSLLPSIQR